MTRAVWLMAAALPLAAQPKLLTNAKLDTRSATASLDREFRALLAAQPQPAWIGYTVAADRASSLGCEGFSGVVHLEPPDQALILFRVEANAVTRIRTIAPDCAIDAGGVPVHWLSDVKPAESVTLLATFVRQPGPADNGALRAVATHAGPEALDLLISIARTDKDSRMRMQAVSALGRTSGPKAASAIRDAIEKDPDAQVKRRAVATLQSLPDGEGIPLLIELVKTARDAEVRKQAMSLLGQSHDTRALAFFEDVLKR